MNKRIRQLAEQAEIDYDLRPEIARAPVWIGTDEELEKFAELIVWECMQIIKVDMYEDAISNMLSKNKLQMIKEHFGVAE